MKLFSFLEKKEALSYFLVLVLRHNKASAVIFEEEKGTVRIVNQHSEYFKDSIEVASDEELLTVLDKTISKAETVLPPNIETQKTIFGLKENWIEENKIKKEYLGKLKKISEELGLTPIGFLITTEAIAHFLAKEEGAPVSAVLAEIDRNFVSATLIRAGKIVETQNSELSTDIPTAIDTLLKHFENVEVLPSRVIIFNEEKDLTQEFIGHQWSKTLPFLHLPQITNLAKGFDAKAVLSGAALEMGFQVLEESQARQIANVPTEETEQPEPARNWLSPEATAGGEKNEENGKPTDDLQTKSFGFVKDKDVAQDMVPRLASPSRSGPEARNVPDRILAEKIAEIPEDLQIEQSETKPLAMNAGIILGGAKLVVGKLLSFASRSILTTPRLASLLKGNKLSLIPAGLVVIFVLLLLLYLFGRSALVTIAIDAKKVSQEKDVTFSASSSTDAAKNIISAQFIDATENGSTSTDATGKKDIGTPAKGTVTMFNNGDGSITFPKGTIITSSNNLKFTLDKDIPVASPSGDASNPQPGTANVAVTANDIGTQHNLPSNTKFTIGTNPLAVYAAKNDNPFSGGTKKSITVVSKDDIAKLESDLVKSLEGKAKEDISKKISGDKILLPVFISQTLANKSVDKKEGDEASKVTLKADVIYKSITYTKADLILFAKGILGQKDNLILDENRITTDVKNIRTKGDEVSTTLNIEGFLIPKINNKDLAKKISGKSIVDTQSLLRNIPQVSDVVIKITPNIPLFPNNLPGTSKIKFQINSNE